MPDIELKPCPFCGSKASHNNGGNSRYGRLWWSVWCDACGNCGVSDVEKWSSQKHGYLDEQFPEGECILRWNTRVAPKVKSLVWVDIRNNAKRAGPYEIRFCQPGVFRIAFHGRIICKSIKGMDRAIEWANNDRKRRILEALL